MSDNLRLAIRNAERLEELVTGFGGTPAEGGELFTQLCVSLLEAMGFTDIYKRKGTEAGRDIDAKYAGKTWS